MRVLTATVDAGGNGPPTAGIVHELTARGHDVRVLGDASQRDTFERQGALFATWATARPWDPRPAKPGARSMLGWLTLASDPGHGRDLLTSAGSWVPDLVMVDCMVPGALRFARTLDAPVALLVHSLSGYWREQWSGRGAMSMWLRLTGTHPASPRSLPDLVVLTSLPELDALDPLDPVLPTSVLQTGPVLPAVPRQPSPPGQDARLLVSMSTIGYPGQAACLQRVLDALAELGTPAVATVGSSVERTALRVPANVELLGFVPHSELLPCVRAVVGHGGHGTTMLALAHGLPVLLLPISRYADQPLVASAVTASGAGLALPRDTPVAQLAAALVQLLADPTLRAAASTLAERLRDGDAAAQAVSGLEQLAATGRA